MASLEQYDNKAYTLGGVVVGILGWLTTGSIWVLVGVIIVSLREAKRQEQIADQFIDAQYSAIALPAAPIPQPPAPTFNNTFNPQLLVNTSTTTANSQKWDSDRLEADADAPLTGEQILKLAIGYPAVLVYGAQGSGKSTVAKWLVRQRIEAGHLVQVLDPHQVAGQWEGNLELVGRGMDYPAIDNALNKFSLLLQSRYHRLSEDANFNPQPFTLVAEEFTNWSSNCKNSGAFWDSCMSDIRKAKCFGLFIAHGRNMNQLGAGKGARTRDETLLEIQLLAGLDPQTGEPKPQMRGTYKFPGGKPVEFDVPKLA